MTPPRVLPPGETQYWLLLTEAEAIHLVSGWVCPTIKGRILGLLDHEQNQARMNESRQCEPSRDRGPTKRRRNTSKRAEADGITAD